MPPAQVALAWLLHKPEVSAPIVGASKPHHLQDAVAAVNLKLTQQEIASLNRRMCPIPYWATTKLSFAAIASISHSIHALSGRVTAITAAGVKRLVTMVLTVCALRLAHPLRQIQMAIIDSADGKTLTKYSIDELKEQAALMRGYSLTALCAAGSGHAGGTLSIMDVAAALYLRCAEHDPRNPDWKMRDRIIWSAGHKAPALYAGLAFSGYFDKEDMMTFAQTGLAVSGASASHETARC